MLGAVACIAVNFWLFRVGILWGVIGLNVTKHVIIAQLCQALGVNRSPDPALVVDSPARSRSEPSVN